MNGFLVAFVWLGLVAIPAAAQPIPSKCNAVKFKATGAYARAILGCQAKSLAKGQGIDEDCLARAFTNLEKTFAKAEKKADCNGSEGAATAQSQADAFRIALGESLLPPLRCCAVSNAGAAQCIWLATETACTDQGGAPGMAGSVCDGETGACVTTSPASGPCCEHGGVCTGGEVEIGACTEAGGAFVEAGICLATGECLAH
jgi:hypothetical protein